ncbi:MAG: 3-hydroxyisobutyrate dehydrogenase [Mycobacteriales bacterium]
MRDHLHPRGAFSTTYALKDITYALELAADAGIGARGAALVREVLAATQEAGWGAEYFPVPRRTMVPPAG